MTIIERAWSILKRQLIARYGRGGAAEFLEFAARMMATTPAAQLPEEPPVGPPLPRSQRGGV